MQLTRPLTVTLALFLPIMAAGQDLPRTVPAPGGERTPPPYAAVKKPVLRTAQRDDLMDFVPGPYPTRGIVMARLGFAGSGIWTAVDFDKQTLERFRRIWTKSNGKDVASASGKVSRPLSGGEYTEIIEKANDIWSPPPGWSPAPPAPVPTDTSCAIALFDDRDVIFGFGAACPAGTEALFSLLHGMEAPTPNQ